ncbi:MAG: NADH-quinone oxidoreductase subunit L, partial [Pseudomonadota bacterium]
FAGFVSKDAIIEVAYVGSTGAFWALVVAAMFTSFYSWRLMFLTFYGTPRGDKHTHEHAHESPATMTAPLGVLAVGSILAGMVFYGPYFGSQEKIDKFFGITSVVEAAHGDEAGHATDEAHGDSHGDDSHATDDAHHGDDSHASDSHGDGHGDAHDRPHQTPGDGAIYVGDDNHVIHEAHLVPKWVKVSPFVAMLLGFVGAWIAYIRAPSLPRQWAANADLAYRFLLNKWYFDEAYDAIFVRPARFLGRFLWKKGDGAVIDGGINGLAMGIVPFVTRALNKAQSGYIFTYAFAMVIGIVILISWTTIGLGN